MFADDTTILGISGVRDEGVRLVKSLIIEWEERYKDVKEEVFELGIDEGV